MKIRIAILATCAGTFAMSPDNMTLANESQNFQLALNYQPSFGCHHRGSFHSLLPATDFGRSNDASACGAPPAVGGCGNCRAGGEPTVEGTPGAEDRELSVLNYEAIEARAGWCAPDHREGVILNRGSATVAMPMGSTVTQIDSLTPVTNLTSSADGSYDSIHAEPRMGVRLSGLPEGNPLKRPAEKRGHGAEKVLAIYIVQDAGGSGSLRVTKEKKRNKPKAATIYNGTITSEPTNTKHAVPRGAKKMK